MGAWGYGPFENDSAGEWLDPIVDKVERTFALALRPLKRVKVTHLDRPIRLTRYQRAVVWRRKVKTVATTRLTMTTDCQNGALAAVVLVRSVPELHKCGGCSRPENLIEQAAKVLDQLLKDEGFIASWNEPKKYVAEIEAEIVRVRSVLLKYALEKEVQVGKYMRQIKRMSKRERASIVRHQAKNGGFWSDGFETAWERVTGKPLPHPPPRPVRPLTKAQIERSAAITATKKRRRARVGLK